MTELDEQVVELLRAAVPQPPNELDPAGIRASANGPARRVRRYAPALAAAVVVAVALGVFFALRQPATHEHTALPPNPTHPATGASPRAATERVVARLFAAAPIPPGAAAVDQSPLHSLNRAPSIPSSSNLVTKHGWWTTSASMADVLGYFAAHLPAGIEQNGSFNSGGRSGETNRGLMFDSSGPPWARPAVYTQLDMLITVAPLTSGPGTGVRVDVQAIWLPQRTAAQRIPLDVTSVDVVVDRNGSAPTVRRTLPAADARSLARIVNDLPVSAPGIFHCPMSRGFVDTVTFHSAQGSLTVHVGADGCGPVTVDGAGKNAPTLSGGRTVDLAILKFLGLPRGYGS